VKTLTIGYSFEGKQLHAEDVVGREACNYETGGHSSCIQAAQKLANGFLTCCSMLVRKPLREVTIHNGPNIRRGRLQHRIYHIWSLYCVMSTTHHALDSSQDQDPRSCHLANPPRPSSPASQKDTPRARYPCQERCWAHSRNSETQRPAPPA